MVKAGKKTTRTKTNPKNAIGAETTNEAPALAAGTETASEAATNIASLMKAVSEEYIIRCKSFFGTMLHNLLCK
jgi:hypothetical protein